MDRRCEIIVEMLKRYTEAQDSGLSGAPGDGTHVPRMPTTWNASYRELERCLKELRASGAPEYWHLHGRFISAESIVLEVVFHKGKAKLPPHCELAAGSAISGQKTSRVRVRRWAPWVKFTYVDRGVEMLSERFRGDPFLPREFQEAA